MENQTKKEHLETTDLNRIKHTTKLLFDAVKIEAISQQLDIFVQHPFTDSVIV